MENQILSQHRLPSTGLIAKPSAETIAVRSSVRGAGYRNDAAMRFEIAGINWMETLHQALFCVQIIHLSGKIIRLRVLIVSDEGDRLLLQTACLQNDAVSRLFVSDKIIRSEACDGSIKQFAYPVHLASDHAVVNSCGTSLALKG